MDRRIVVTDGRYACCTWSNGLVPPAGSSPRTAISPSRPRQVFGDYNRRMWSAKRKLGPRRVWLSLPTARADGYKQVEILEEPAPVQGMAQKGVLRYLQTISSPPLGGPDHSIVTRWRCLRRGTTCRPRSAMKSFACLAEDESEAVGSMGDGSAHALCRKAALCTIIPQQLPGHESADRSLRREHRHVAADAKWTEATFRARASRTPNRSFLSSPILSPAQLRQLMGRRIPAFRHESSNLPIR